jgi:hypothetical protein
MAGYWAVVHMMCRPITEPKRYQEITVHCGSIEDMFITSYELKLVAGGAVHQSVH